MTQNQIRFAELQEAKRHNLALEGKEFQALGESIRHNVATEAEASKHNRTVESINWYDAQSAAALRSSQGIAALENQQSQRIHAEAAREQASVARTEVTATYIKAASDVVKSIASVVSPFAKLFG